MAVEFYAERLALAITDQRGDMGLRNLAATIGNVSASTLSRIEGGALPDLLTYVRICRWLGVSLDTFVPEQPREAIPAHLRCDRTLDPRTATALRELVVAAQRLLAGARSNAEAPDA